MTRCGLKIAFTALLCGLVWAGGPIGPTAAQTLADVARASQGEPNGLNDPNGLFGSIELRSESLKGLPQWLRVLTSMRADQDSFDRCAADSRYCSTPILKNWRKVISSATGLSRPKQIKAINDFFNRWPYKQDRELYGLSEYWATPREFMTRSGDCEDYAIAKYFALRALGFNKDDMRVVILMDDIRGIGHAVLAIYQEDDILILDSLSNLIVPHVRYKHYIPQYSMNETTRWAHIGSFQKDTRQPYQGLLAHK